MKRLSKKLISIILIIAMVFSSTITNFAIDDLTLGENNSVETFSTEGENNSFVATDSDLDSLNDNADEEEELNDKEQDSNDAATSSEIDNDTEKNENDNKTKTNLEDENDTASTPSDIVDEGESVSTPSDIINEDDNVSTPSDIEDIIASVSEIDNRIENIATISDIEISLIEIASKSNIKIATNSILFGDKATTSNIKKYRNGLIRTNLDFPIPQKNDEDLFGSSPLSPSFDSRTVKNPANESMSIIPPLKDQGQHSTCWAFATMGLVETSLRKQGLVKTEAESDLSELALAYFSYNLKDITNNSAYIDTPGLEENDYSEVIDPTENFDSFGGSVLYASLLGTAYMGMVREDADPLLEYKPREAFPSSLDGNLAFKNNSYVIKNALFLNKNDRDSIKQAIKDYGAVSISFLGDGDLTTLFYDNVINGEHYLFPSGDPDSSNHAIIIVGWDDTVPASNFRNLLQGTAPVNDGAWICKNSWGDYEFGNNGYFYMSYDEPSIDKDMYAIEAMKADTYKYNYHYDTTTSGTARGWNLPSSYNYVFSNVFKVHDDVTLDAVNFATQSANVNMDILIYKKDTAMSQPNDGTLALKQSDISLTYPGVYTIELDQKINLTKDSYYSIVLRPKSTSNNKFFLMTDQNSVMQIEKKDSSGNTILVDALQTVSRAYPKQSFMGSNLDDQYSWADLNPSSTDGFGDIFRIRGLANPVQATPAPASGVDYVLNPGWYSSTTLSQTLASSNIEKIEIRTYGVDSEPDNTYTAYDIPNSSVNSDNKLLKLYHKAGTNDVIIYAPKLDSVNKVVTIKMADDASYLFSGDGTKATNWVIPPQVLNTFSSLKSIEGLEKLNTTSTTNMQGMFAQCRMLETFDLSSFNTANVTDMSFMFYNALKDVNDLDLSNFSTSTVTNFADMFNGTNVKHIDVSSFDTSSATNMCMMFCDFSGAHLESIDLSNFDTSNVTDMTHMISAPNVSSIDVSSFDTSKVTSLEGLFWNMSKLTSIDVSNFNLSSATNIRYMFWGCSNITNLDLTNFDTSAATQLDNMFEGCSKLERIVVSDTFTIRGSANTSNMFASCTSLRGPYTVFDENIVDGTYARIDTPTTPGYFTSDSAPAVYTINYNAKGGTLTGDTSFTKTKGTPITSELATPTKTGYSFGGWYVDDNTFNTPYNKANDDIYVSGTYSYTIYAKWVANTYNISFNLGTVAATAPSPVSKTYGVARTEALPEPSNVPAGYTFVAWYKESSCTTEWTGLVAADDLTTDNGVTISVYAKWKRTIVFNVLYNGTDINATKPSSQEITGATNITLPSTSATGYTFGGWYREEGLTNFVGMNDLSVPVDAPTTFYAKWTPITYKIYYKNVDGSSITDGEFVTKTYGSNATLNTSPTKEGFTFEGWFTDNNTFNNSYDGTSDLANTQDNDKNIYAKWTAHEYTVNYNLAGVSATAPTPITKTYGQALAANVLKNPTNIPTGYTFAGWYKESTYTNEWTGNDDLTNGTTAQTIHARWKAKITYNQNGHGTAPAAVDVYLNNTTTLPGINNVTGYTFDTTNSWYDDSNIATAILIGSSGSNYTVTEPKTLYAKWNENEYTITYHNVAASDGVNWSTEFTPKTNRKYSEAVTLPIAANLSKNDGTNDYIFKGWWTLDGTTSNNWGIQVTEIAANTASLTGGHEFYARWNPAWMVGFNMLGHGTPLNYITVENETLVPTAKIPATPTATGFIFKGWFKTYDASAATFDAKYSDEWNFSTMNVTENMVLFAKWQPITYTIKYNANGGTISKNTDTKTYDTNLTLVTPTKTGHDFGGWFTDNNTFNNSYDGTTNLSTTNGDTKDIYAKWTPHTYTVSFNIGTVAATAPSPVSKTYGVARTDALPNPTNIPAGYEFLGWYKEEAYTNEWTGLSATDDLTSDNAITVSVYAKWKRAIVFNVLYNGTNINATTPPSQEITGATNITLPSTSATGYTFGGWYREEGLTNFVGMDGLSVPVDAPTTFYAKWTPITYKIYYKNVDGSSITDGEFVTKTYGSNATLNTSPTKEGFTFDGWFTDNNTFNNSYNGTTDLANTQDNDKNIYAKWTAHEYTVNYNLAGVSATAPTPITKTYGQALAANVLKNPTNIPTGYTFAGWYKESTYTNEWTGSDDLTNGTTAQTIYARWKAKITYNQNGHGTAPAAVDVYLNNTTTLPGINNVTGYTFDTTNSWYDDSNIATAILIGSSGSNYTVTEPKTLYAKWNENEYTITYHNVAASDGVNWSTEFTPKTNRKYSEAVTLPVAANLSKNDGTNDYIFKGWWTLDGTTSNNWGSQVTEIAANTVAPTGGHVFYARWNPAWKIGFNMLGHGTTPNYITAEQGTKVLSSLIPATPTATGFIFKGWFKTYDASAATFDAKYSDEWNFSTMNVTENMVLFAKWQPITYTIKYNANGGTVSKNTDTKTYDANLTLVTPTKTGHDFGGWFTDNNTFNNSYDGTTNLSTTNGDTKDIYAKWTPHTYTVSFNIGTVAATAPSPISKTYGVARTDALPNPTNIPAGYEFLGWYKEEAYTNEWTGLSATDDLTSDNAVTVSVYAKWKRAIVFNVLYNGTNINATTPPSQEITGATNITLPSTSATGYTFGGWYREEGLTNFVGMNDLSVPVDAPTTFYAKWTPKTYTINYNAKSGTITGDTSFTKAYGTAITTDLVTPTKAGYTFNGWFTDDNTFNIPYNKANDAIYVEGTTTYTIFAKWTAKTYTINYNAKGGTITGDTSFTKTYGTAITTNLATPTKAGYTFNGWFTDDNTFNTPYNKANDAIYVEGTTTYTIFAKWTAKTYTINYNAKGGTITGDTSFTKTYGTAITTDLVTPTKTGFTFNGWFTDDNTFNNAYNKANDAIYVEGTTTYTIFAKWTENTYNIIYHNDNLSGVTYATNYTKPTSRKYTQEITLPNSSQISRKDALREYKFDGWWTADGSTSNNWGTKVEKITANNTDTTAVHEFYAKWIPIWNVSFNMSGYGGTAPTTQQIIDKGKATKPTNKPTAEGKKFLGWYDSNLDTANPFNFNSEITSDTVIYAKWQDAVTIKFTFNMNGHDAQIDSKFVAEGESLDKPTDPKADGYTFKYWYEADENTAFDFTTIIPATSESARTLTAKWDANTYTIKYMAKGGTVNPTQITKTYGVPITTLAKPVMEGYTFVDWFTDDNTFANKYTGTDLSTLQNAIINIYAKWNENSYKITLNTNEGTYINNFAAKTNRKYTEAYTLPTANNIEKSGFTFVGWFDNEKFEGTAITSIPTKTIGDKIYWLKWEEIKQETNNNSSSSSNSGSSGGSSGRSIAALPNTQQQQPANQTQTQTGPGNMPSTKLSVDTSSVNHFNATENSTWSKDSSGNWHISITDASGQAVEVKNAWCSVRSVKMVDNVPITVDDYYFLGSDGTMLTGWLTDANNKTYYLGTESWNIGRMARGWEKIGDKYYYFNTDGLLVTNSVTPDGYKLDATGAWII